MVWSEQVGTSLIVPSDRVPGDGRNYIVVGEDVPAQITDQFTAALVFRSGKYDGSAVTDLDIPGGGPRTGFVFYALGISKAGNLEFVVYFFSTLSNSGDLYTYFRQTVLSVTSPPFPVAAPGQPNGPVLALGSSSTYDTYTEGPATTVVISGEQVTTSNPTLNTPWINLDAVTYGPVTLSIVGKVASLNGYIKNNGATSIGASAALFTIPTAYVPAFRQPFNAKGAGTGSVRVDVEPNGVIAVVGGDTPVAAGGTIVLSGINWIVGG